MGLETASFISGLTPSWPTASELKSQGDDHIRLIKATLQNTFPNAGKAFYLPTAEAITGTQILDATDQNNTQLVDTTSGNIAVTLPSGLGAADKGWSVDIVKTSTDYNAVIVSAASGNINSKSGTTASIRVGIVCEPATFRWTGAGWICSKPGPMIGTTESFDGIAIPPGYLVADGSAFSNVSFAELFAVMGGSSVFDKRGRVEAGTDPTGIRLTAVSLGSVANRGAANGVEAVAITPNQMASHFHTAGIYDGGHVHGVSGGTIGGSSTIFRAQTTVTDGTSPLSATAITINAAVTGVRVNSGNGLDTTNTAGADQAHTNLQPTVCVYKMVRAC